MGEDPLNVAMLVLVMRTDGIRLRTSPLLPLLDATLPALPEAALNIYLFWREVDATPPPSSAGRGRKRKAASM
jgi:hypothetical protein